MIVDAAIWSTVIEQDLTVFIRYGDGLFGDTDGSGYGAGYGDEEGEGGRDRWKGCGCGGLDGGGRPLPTLHSPVSAMYVTK